MGQPVCKPNFRSAKGPISLTSALVLCRTPFQACLIPEVLRAEKVDDYELLYLTHQDSEEDVSYFKMLAVGASRAAAEHQRVAGIVLEQVLPLEIHDALCFGGGLGFGRQCHFFMIQAEPEC